MQLYLQAECLVCILWKKADELQWLWMTRLAVPQCFKSRSRFLFYFFIFFGVGAGNTNKPDSQIREFYNNASTQEIDKEPKSIESTFAIHNKESVMCSGLNEQH